MTGRQYFMPRNTLVSVTAITRFQLSSVISSSGAGSARPALFIMTSSRPKRSRARRTVRSTASGSDASIFSETARPPSCAMLEATASARVPLRSATTTAAPSSAKRRALAAPMPEPPAVTIATCPSKRPAIAEGLAHAMTLDRGFVELEAETRARRSHQLAVLYPGHRLQNAGRPGNVLHHVTVGDGREQVHLHFRHHVAA